MIITKKNAILMIMLLSTLAFGDKLTVIVGAVGEDPKPGFRKALETQIKEAFVKDGRFTAITRDEAVLAKLNQEQAYQRGGAVDDKQIRAIGKQAGARYVCSVEISELMESFMLSVQFIDIESAKIITMASVPSALKNSGDFLAASEELVFKILGARPEGSESGYGSGIFLDDKASTNPLSEQFTQILKQKIAVSDGTCVGGATVSIESPSEPACSEGMIGQVCRADIKLIITQCKGGKKTVLSGSVVGSDKTSMASARRQFERNMNNAKFWSQWVSELEKRAKQ